jgi:hypothetical protein
MNGVLCLWLAASDALILISFQAGNFEESVEVIKLLWPYALSIPSVYIKMVAFLPTYYRPLPCHCYTNTQLLVDGLRRSDVSRSCIQARVMALFTRLNICARVILHSGSRGRKTGKKAFRGFAVRNRLNKTMPLIHPVLAAIAMTFFFAVYTANSKVTRLTPAKSTS